MDSSFLATLNSPLEIKDVITNIVISIINAIPSIIAALIIIGLGYIVGEGVGKAVNKLVEITKIEENFDKTETGKAFRQAGIDLSSFIGSLTKAFVVVISLAVALQVLNIGGPISQYIIFIADYLPRIIGAILVLTLGVVLFEFLTSFIAKALSTTLPERHKDLADLLKDLIMIGLIAVLVTVALNMLLLPGEYVYPLILGAVIIGVGISITERLVNSIVENHEEFKPVAGHAKFLLYLIFVIVGVAGMFSSFPGTSNVIANVAWGVAIAAALMLVPMIYRLSKDLIKQS